MALFLAALRISAEATDSWDDNVAPDRFIGEVLAGEGVAKRVGTTVRGGHHDGSGLTMELGDGDQHAPERLLVTTCRRTDLASLDVYRLPLVRDILGQTGRPAS